MKKNFMRGICLFVILLMAGCGKPNGESESSQGNSASQNMVSENAFADTANENQTWVTVSDNDSQDIVEEMEVFDLSNGLYAYVTTKVSRDIAIKGVTEWIEIQHRNISRNEMMIPNVYGTITDVQMDDYSKIYIYYEDNEEKSRQAVIPIDVYVPKGNDIDPLYGWIGRRSRFLAFNREELTNETVLPVEVWRETFISGEKEYTAVYSRISPVYGLLGSDFDPWMADYQFAIWQGDKTLYEVKMYQMGIMYEEIHYMEDINGDGVEDFIQINNNSCYGEDTAPYVFVWDPEQETCIYGEAIAPEEKAEYESQDNLSDGPIYTTVLYDRDTRIFYDANATERNAIYGHDIHGMVIVCGAKFIEGEWKTVYEMYLGEDYARETKYDEEGNVISEIQYSEDDQYDVVNSIYTGCELFLFVFRPDYTKEEIVVNEQFSYWKYVINEE